jgi:3,4-dihydroxy 2-butanone 4-phosphate synthase/GTP cyclohydrolase II
MKLSEYLSLAKVKDADFALAIGKDRSTVSRLRRTNQCPSRETIEAIARETKGAVTANDFWLTSAEAA